MEKFICIHGHFYQPPRENPWLEAVEVQDSAAPYHDWNERITMECYGPNSSARILDGEGRIEQITSNYSKISFNFGPTLLAWMKDKIPEVHEAIVAADQLSREHYSGHGSALAQVYNHMILPLANTRDKYTQVLWGIRDFEYRFGRAPEGMWLSETAVDTPTLETLAELGLKFTVLSPFQASRVREMGKRNSRDVNGGQIDPTRPYRMKLPSGRSMTLFFYDGPVSQAVAFENLLTSGERLAQRLMGAFNDRRQWDQLVHIATDGESYGHHHHHGEMALAYALHYIESNKLARLTNYGEYLEKHPPTHEAQIHEKSSWSCVHGVGRWMLDCGCNSGGHSGWSQAWRAPLRQAMDWLRDELTPLYETKAKEFLRDPWKARNDYISVILDRSPERQDRFFAENALRELNENQKVTVRKLLELQRHAMLMYTSCGWFFDEISGLESVQVAQYAARALQLAQEIFGKELEPGFLERFEHAKSNLPQNGDGRRIFNRLVKPAMIDWPRTTAHYAISSIFEQYSAQTKIFSYFFEDEDRHLLTSGKTRLAVGRTKVTAEITHESRVLVYAIFYLGEHNLTGGIRYFDSLATYEAIVRDSKAAYEQADFPAVIRVIDRHFGKVTYSLDSLFRDEQRRILKEILASTREDLESRFRLIAERYAPLMKFLQSAGVPLPPGLDTVTGFVLQADLVRQVEAETLDFERLRQLIEEAHARDAQALDGHLGFVVTKRLERMMQEVGGHIEAPERMALLQRFAEMMQQLPLGLNLSKVQNSYWALCQKVFPEFNEHATAGDEAAQTWVNSFLALGETLGFAVKRLKGAEAGVKLAA